MPRFIIAHDGRSSAEEWRHRLTTAKRRSRGDERSTVYASIDVNVVVTFVNAEIDGGDAEVMVKFSPVAGCRCESAVRWPMEAKPYAGEPSPSLLEWEVSRVALAKLSGQPVPWKFRRLYASPCSQVWRDGAGSCHRSSYCDITVRQPATSTGWSRGRSYGFGGSVTCTGTIHYDTAHALVEASADRRRPGQGARSFINVGDEDGTMVVRRRPRVGGVAEPLSVARRCTDAAGGFGGGIIGVVA